MAETKYDLLLHPTKKDSKVYLKPWYKERLRERYIKSLDPCSVAKFIDSSKWTFLKGGLDDFRNGVPPPVTDDIFIKGRQGLSPVVTGSKSAPAKRSVRSGSIPKSDVCYSRISPMQKQRLENVEMIERALTQHPLALYPHLEQCLPPELFEEVITVLDPEMAMQAGDSDDSETCSNVSSTDRPAVYDEQEKPDEPIDDTGSERSESRVRNPYRWLPEVDEVEKKDKKGTSEPRKSFLKSEEDEHVKTVTQQFCEWVASLGGDSNNIEESTITSLFASGYETKPALSVPIHVVELANVPPELRLSAAPVPPSQPQSARSRTPAIQHTGCSSTYTPSWVKYKYGAWYLDPKHWKKRPADEPLRDPKDSKDSDMSEAKQKSINLDFDLAPLSGVKLFKEFIEKKDTRRPEFIEHVAAIQEQQQREEQAHLEAEMLRQKKPSAGNRPVRSPNK